MILAALIEYDVDGVTKYLGVTDGKYRDTTGVSLEAGLWYNALSSDVSWSESARHPYQEQGGELVVGDLVLANDGTFDFLMDADIVGMKVTLKRGDRDESWADMEQIFIARIAGRRFEGHSVIIELDNWLAKLSGPVFTETFDSDTPNPQLVGKQIPYVLGKVTQAPVLEYDPNNLTYYTGENVSLIGEVTEGGNPTQKWHLDEQPKFDLKGSPTLPITATFEGPSETPWTTVIDDDLDTWVSGSDTSLGSGYTSQGDRPDGWTLVVGTRTGLSVSQSGGLRINDSSSSLLLSSTASTTANALSVQEKSSSVSWTNASSAVRDDSGAATITTGGDKTDAILAEVSTFQSASVLFRTNHSVTSGSVYLDAVELIKGGSTVYRESFNQSLGGGGRVETLSQLWDFVLPSELNNSVELKMKLSDGQSGDYSLDDFYLEGRYSSNPSVHLRRDLSLASGQPHNVLIEGSTSDNVSLMWGASNSTEGDWPEHDEYAGFISKDNAEKVTGDFELRSTVTPSGTVFDLSYQPSYKAGEGGFSMGDVTVTRIKITKQSGGNKSYKGLAPHVIEQLGYTSSEYDQASFNTHADEYGDPELGWLITKNETADQVLFRLAGSLNGYVWHGLDGKVRSKRLKAPAEVSDPFVIDSARANPAEIVAYDDPAPNLRKSVNALRNWKPLDTDDTAGITTTWTEEDRAKVTTDWRITRAWEMGTDGKDEFTRRWPNVASREPFATALRDATTCQLIANEGPDTWIQRPMFYEVPVYVDKGEFAKVATGETVKAELDYPGLEDAWLLVLGRSGTATPGVVNLTLWSADQSPVALIAPYRFDPRITFTRSSTAWYWNSSGVLTEAAAGEARLDYDPSDNSVKGWLFEEARTNELLDNRDLSTGNWSDIGTISKSQDSSGLDGVASTAWTITDADTGSAGRAQQTITVPDDSNTHSIKAYIEKNSGDEANGFPAVQAILSGGTQQRHAVNIDTRDGTNANTSGRGDGSHTVRDAGSWWEVEIQIANNGTGNTSLMFEIYPAMTSSLGGALSATATGTVVYDFGQVELNASESTSPIETGSSAVTRAKDVAKIDGSNFTPLWNASEGTLVAEWIFLGGGVGQDIVSVNDGTSSEEIEIDEAGSGRCLLKDGGSTTGSVIPAGGSAGTEYRLAAGFDADEIAASALGGTVVTDTGVSAMPTVDQMEIGARLGTTKNNHVRYLYYYPTKLTDEQLATASTVGRDLILDKV